MILATSTSKPVSLPSRPLSPNPGWSNLVPTFILPAAEILAMVVPASRLGFAATFGASVLSEPQALRVRAATAKPATTILRLCPIVSS